MGSLSDISTALESFKKETVRFFETTATDVRRGAYRSPTERVLFPIHDTGLQLACDQYSSSQTFLTDAMARLEHWKEQLNLALWSVHTSNPPFAASWTAACASVDAILNRETLSVISSVLAPLRAELDAIDALRSSAVQARFKLEKLAGAKETTAVRTVLPAERWETEAQANAEALRGQFLAAMSAFLARFNGVRKEAIALLWQQKNRIADALLEGVGAEGEEPPPVAVDFADVDAAIADARVQRPAAPADVDRNTPLLAGSPGQDSS